MQKSVYVCVVPYHLYLSLILIECKSNRENSVVLLNANDSKIYEQFCSLKTRLEDYNFKVDVRLRDLKKDILGIEEIENKKQYKTVCSMFGEDISGKFILYNFAWNCQYVYTTANIYYKKCEKAIFVEEGALTAINPPQSSIKILVKKIQGGSVDFYKDEKLEGIYVQQPEIYSKEWERKLRKFDISDLLKELNVESKKVVADIFLGDLTETLSKQLVDVGIIYTQPLSEDGFISEEEKIDYYTQMVQFYSKYGNPVLKLHPRDTSIYNLEDICTVLPAYFPSELLGLLNIRFKYAVGICTSAVPTTDAEYKLNINENFLTDSRFRLLPLE
ncbi:MAG: glycosyltransferase family 52 protein [Lachnospiraceae bacterium]|nr:glycosyltransferase family 52 protein [Lachnospiraceae bacterium]